MPLPGLSLPASGFRKLLIATPQVDYDFFAAIGSPGFPVTYKVSVTASMTSSGPTIPAWDDTGIHPDSRIIMQLVAGVKILGAGGAGGHGGITIAGPNIAQGGGGGGAGQIVGPGGIGAYLVSGIGVDGSPGTELAGGAGAVSVFAASSFAHVGTRPGDGGDAMRIGCDYQFINAAEIRGGGGGGCPSNDSSPGAGDGPSTAGGVPGADGVTGIDPVDGVSAYQSPGGNAIRLVGGTAAATFLSGGTPPNVQGAVSA